MCSVAPQEVGQEWFSAHGTGVQCPIQAHPCAQPATTGTKQDDAQLSRPAGSKQGSVQPRTSAHLSTPGNSMYDALRSSQTASSRRQAAGSNSQQLRRGAAKPARRRSRREAGGRRLRRPNASRRHNLQPRGAAHPGQTPPQTRARSPPAAAGSRGRAPRRAAPRGRPPAAAAAPAPLSGGRPRSRRPAGRASGRPGVRECVGGAASRLATFTPPCVKVALEGAPSVGACAVHAPSTARQHPRHGQLAHSGGVNAGARPTRQPPLPAQTASPGPHRREGVLPRRAHAPPLVHQLRKGGGPRGGHPGQRLQADEARAPAGASSGAEC